MNSSQLIQWLKTKNAYEIMSHNKITFLMCRTNPFHVKKCMDYELMCTCCISTVVHRTSVQKNTETEVSSSDDTNIIII